jgi:hypothetical protein
MLSGQDVTGVSAPKAVAPGVDSPMHEISSRWLPRNESIYFMPQPLQTSRRLPRHGGVLLLLSQAVQKLACRRRAELLQNFQHSSSTQTLRIEAADDFFKTCRGSSEPACS